MKPVSEATALFQVKALLKTVVFFLAAVLMLSCTPRHDNDDSAGIAKDANKEGFDTREQEKNANFIVDAVANSYAEVRMAQLAQNRSDNNEVKEVAVMLEKDHAKMLTQLKGFAGTKGISIPTEENEQAKKKLNDMSGEQGTKFDQKWCKELVSKHEKTIQDFEDMWEKTEDDDLKDLINETLPDLRTHLVKLSSCREKLTM
jgi:putative membrane protein